MFVHYETFASKNVDEVIFFFGRGRHGVKNVLKCMFVPGNKPLHWQFTFLTNFCRLWFMIHILARQILTGTLSV